VFSHNAATCTIGTQPIPKAIPNFTGEVFEMRNVDRSQRVSLFNNGAVIIMSGSAVIRLDKNGAISIISATKITAKAPQIILDGDTTVTKSLTVQGGMAVSGAIGGQTATFTGNMKMDGNITQTGTFTLGGVTVNSHTHTNPEGGNVGPMK
jgi:phage baseplate assembly protein gpV